VEVGGFGLASFSVGAIVGVDVGGILEAELGRRGIALPHSILLSLNHS
jgi:hypothetical protein